MSKLVDSEKWIDLLELTVCDLVLVSLDTWVLIIIHLLTSSFSKSELHKIISFTSIEFIPV